MLHEITYTRNQWYDILAFMFGRHLTGWYDRDLALCILHSVSPNETHDPIMIPMVGGTADYLNDVLEAMQR